MLFHFHKDCTCSVYSYTYKLIGNLHTIIFSSPAPVSQSFYEMHFSASSHNNNECNRKEKLSNTNNFLGLTSSNWNQIQSKCKLGQFSNICYILSVTLSSNQYLSFPIIGLVGCSNGGTGFHDCLWQGGFYY